MPIFRFSSLLDLGAGRAWIDERAADVQLWLEALKAPAYPGEIDSKLAEAGAILFHNKDLWASELDNPVPRPAGGNGSCASCHGVYAPRYARDPAYLAVPELEGIAAFVVPIEIIDTDRARFASLNDGLKKTLQHSWWGYGTNEEPGACFGAIGEGGYLAPPLYGVWATAPYLHNGSVPNVWEVLKPEDRKPIWKRVSAPPPESDATAFTGFDTNLARAYDHARLGFRYEELPCGDAPEVACISADPETNPAADALASGPFSEVWFTWNLDAQPVDAATLEKRKIYNTYKYSQGNGGHAFTAVLTDAERRALIEYLKTL
jgi:mono/diheme cytochrome c family protein